MDILIIGYSNIVQRRVLPALLHIPAINQVDIASRSSASKISLPVGYEGEFFSNYDEALSKSKANLVYISTVNSEHAQWAKESLKRGFDVIVEKPSFTSINDVKQLVNLSKKHGLCLAEATVFAYHPQIQLAKDIFLKAASRPTRLTAMFSFPPLTPDNFRYKKETGGGAIWDTGPYAVSIGRLFFNEEPKEIFCRICSRSGNDNVETSYSMLSIYSGGKSMIGHFGFNTEYRNTLNLLGPDMSIDIDRIFTTPAEMENELRVIQHNDVSVIRAPKADNFAIFIQNIIDGIQTGNYNEFTDNLLSDASVLHRLRLAADK